MHVHRNDLLRTLIAATIVLTTVFGALQAQDERDLFVSGSPVSSTWSRQLPPRQVAQVVAGGQRIVNIEVDAVAPLRLSIATVQNTGAFRKTWWWYYDKTSTQIRALLAAHDAYLIDIEPYYLGSLRYYAVLMVQNGTGMDRKSTRYYSGATLRTLTDTIGSGYRMLAWERFSSGRSTLYAACFVANTGSDQRTWWCAEDQSASEARILLNQRQAIPVDIDEVQGGRYNVIMHENTGGATTWLEFGRAANEVTSRMKQFTSRPVDIDHFGGNSHNIVMIRNCTDLSERAGNILRRIGSGDCGLILKRIGGPVLAEVWPEYEFEPASLLKTLLHAHVMKEVADGRLRLEQRTVTNLGKDISCPTGRGDNVTEPWRTVVELMMQQSDNCRTRTVHVRYGTAAIHATAAALGMRNTRLNHTIGCTSPKNDLTLNDLVSLHESIAGGYLGTSREEFYEIMQSRTTRFPGRVHSLDSLIDSEAADLGIGASDRNAFKSLVRLAYKGGSYNHGVDQDRTRGGFLRLPVVVAGVLDFREYAFGAFVNKTQDPMAEMHLTYALFDVMREEVREALRTVDGAGLRRAGFRQFDNACRGSNSRLLQHDGSGQPFAGADVYYRTPHVAGDAVADLVRDRAIQRLHPGNDRLLPARRDQLVRHVDCRCIRCGILPLVGQYSAAMIGTELNSQAVAFDRWANPAGLVSSARLRTRIGGLN